jgi:hypothetical protein
VLARPLLTRDEVRRALSRRSVATTDELASRARRFRRGLRSGLVAVDDPSRATSVEVVRPEHDGREEDRRGP